MKLYKVGINPMKNLSETEYKFLSENWHLKKDTDTGMEIFYVDRMTVEALMDKYTEQLHIMYLLYAFLSALDSIEGNELELAIGE